MHTRRINGNHSWAVVLAGLSLAAWGGTGCDSKLAKEFREASRPQLESGVNSVMGGLLDGVFTLWEPDSSSSSEAAGN